MWNDYTWPPQKLEASRKSQQKMPQTAEGLNQRCQELESGTRITFSRLHRISCWFPTFFANIQLCFLFWELGKYDGRSIMPSWRLHQRIANLCGFLFAFPPGVVYWTAIWNSRNLVATQKLRTIDYQVCWYRSKIVIPQSMWKLWQKHVPNHPKKMTQNIPYL